MDHRLPTTGNSESWFVFVRRFIRWPATGSSSWTAGETARPLNDSDVFEPGDSVTMNCKSTRHGGGLQDV